MDRAGGKAAGGGGERIAYVDAARGLAILCVVLGHLYPGDGIVQYISSFHVPVFFILSGLLMAARDGWKTRRLTEFAAKKAKRLLYPYATISALNLALIFTRRGKKAMLRQLTATLLGEGIDALWFLSALFLAEIAFKIVMSFKRRGLRIAAFLCMAVGTAGFSYLGLGAVQREGLAQLLGLANVVSRALVGCILIGMGYGYGRVRARVRLSRAAQYGLMAAAFALNLALFRFNAVDLHYSLIGNPALYYANAAAGSYALMKLCELAFAENRFLRFWGRNSTVVFATHLNFGILEITKAVTAAALHGRCIPAEFAITLLIEAALVFAVNRYAKGLVDCDAAAKMLRRGGKA